MYMLYSLPWIRHISALHNGWEEESRRAAVPKRSGYFYVYYFCRTQVPTAWKTSLAWLSQSTVAHWAHSSFNTVKHCSYNVNLHLQVQEQQGKPIANSLAFFSCEKQVTYYAADCFSKRSLGFHIIRVPVQRNTDTTKTSLSKREVMELDSPRRRFTIDLPYF